MTSVANISSNTFRRPIIYIYTHIYVFIYVYTRMYTEVASSHFLNREQKLKYFKVTEI